MNELSNNLRAKRRSVKLVRSRNLKKIGETSKHELIK